MQNGPENPRKSGFQDQNHGYSIFDIFDMWETFFFWCSMKKMYKYEKLSIGWNLLLTNFHKAAIKNEDFLLIATSRDKIFFFQKWLEIDIFFSTNDGWWTKMSFWPLKNVNPADYGPLWPLLGINDFSVENRISWDFRVHFATVSLNKTFLF